MNSSPLETSPFTIDVAQEVLDDLDARLARVRWPRVADPADDADGMSLRLAQQLVEHWREHFDWRAVEASLNTLNHRSAEIDGVTVHHVHERATTGSTGSAGSAAGVPVLLLHGWPDSFARYVEVIAPLTAAGHDVVVPSLPGYAFSGEPTGQLSVAYLAETVHTLMTGLGYARYAIAGGDWGSLVAERVAADHPDAVVALHLTDVPFTHLLELDPGSASGAELAMLEANEAQDGRLAYQSVHSFKPTVLSFGLADSPVALATWLYEKFRAWSDREPDLDVVLTHVMIMWVTGTERSALRPYSEAFGWGDEPIRATVPAAFAIFPVDLSQPPREYAERFFDVRRFTAMPRSGHFAAIDEPKLWAEDVLAFLEETGR